jgi:hypothetical protein
MNSEAQLRDQPEMAEPVDTFAYVPVPLAWLPTVYAVLGKLSDERLVAAKVPGDIPDDSISDDLIAKMYRESHEQHRALMEYLARHPDEWFYTSDLAAALQLQHGARGLAGMLGAFGRRAKHRYGGLKPWDSDWDAFREEARHRMTAEVAKVVRGLA